MVGGVAGAVCVNALAATRLQASVIARPRGRRWHMGVRKQSLSVRYSDGAGAPRPSD